MKTIVLESSAGPTVVVDGRELIYLGGTGYLGMNRDPRVLQAVERGLGRWGMSSSASRTTSGSAAPHLELERRLERILGAESVVLAATAYLGNTIRCQSLRDEFDVVLMDALAHPSLVEGATLSGKAIETFEHGDAGHARELLVKARESNRRALLATDAVFATSGVLAPLDAYLELAREFDAALHIDDAHGFGVLGRSGRGTPEEFGISHRELTVSATFSKALGCFGGFVSGGGALGERVASSGAYVGATPTPPAIIEGVIASVEEVFEDGSCRERLRRHSARVKEGLRDLGLEFPDSPMPIARFTVGDEATSRRVSGRLVDRGVLIPYIVYPGGPPGGFFRLAVTAVHEESQLDQALGVLRDALG